MIKKIFAWWDGATLGALFDIKRRSSLIGQDEYGNVYYEERKAVSGFHNKRYVIYKGLAEPSKVPASWHGWLHHAVELPPTEAPLDRQGFEIDHTPNMTGTPWATRPKNSLKNTSSMAEVTDTYEAWKPDA